MTEELRKIRMSEFRAIRIDKFFRDLSELNQASQLLELIEVHGSTGAAIAMLVGACNALAGSILLAQMAPDIPTRFRLSALKEIESAVKQLAELEEVKSDG